jgi:hypothetical protein
MSILKKIYLPLIAMICFLSQTKAQVQVFEKDVLDKIKNGKTHVIVKSQVFPDADEYADVFKKYFTVTQGVDFIAEDDVVGNLVAGDTYFSLEAEKITGSSGATVIFVYFNLWQPTQKMLKDKKFKIGHEYALAHIQVSIDLEAVKSIYSNSLDFNLDGDGHLYHWNPGLIKNYLQQLCEVLKSGKKVDFHDDVTDKAKLKELSTKTLYCPEDNFNKMGTFVRAGKTVDVKDVFEDYKFDYKTISDKDIGEKILNDKEPFYYIIFLRNSTSKLIEVVNSQTGEVIYSRYDRSMFIPNLKSGDLKDLYKAVKKID